MSQDLHGGGPDGPDRSEPYRVGYGHPPRHTRFAPGRSGNPRGRPKGSRSLAQLLTRELDGRVSVTENGVARRISKREVLAKRLVNEALACKPKPLELVLGMDREVAATLSQVADALISPPDEMTKSALIRRLQQAVRSEPDAEPGQRSGEVGP